MNTFSYPGSSTGSSPVTVPIYDPRSVRTNRERFRRDKIPMLERANSIYIPNGRWPSRGWVLLARSDYDLINKSSSTGLYANSFELEVGDSTDKDTTNALTNLSIVQAQCVMRGVASDPNALYLVELTDDRGILHNKWFQAPITAFYNIRAPAYPQTFYAPSTNSGTPWTWACCQCCRSSCLPEMRPSGR